MPSVFGDLIGAIMVTPLIIILLHHSVQIFVINLKIVTEFQRVQCNNYTLVAKMSNMACDKSKHDYLL